MFQAAFIVALLVLLVAPDSNAQTVAQDQAQDANASGTTEDLIIEAGVKVGSIRVGSSREEALGIIPQASEHNHRCGMTQIVSQSPDYQGLRLYLQDGKVFQIHTHFNAKYRLSSGIAYRSETDLIRRDFPQMQSYTLPGSPRSRDRSYRGPEPDSRGVIPRTTTYWVDESRGIAFQLDFDPQVWGYLVSDIVVFPPENRFYVEACPSWPYDNFVSLGPSGLPPSGPGVSVIRSFPSETVKDEAIDRAVRKFIQASGLDEYVRPFSRYLYNKVDLNGDGEPEALVYLEISCGSAGCQFLVMERKGIEYEVITDISPIKAPVIVSNERTNGWNDLIFWFRIVQLNGYAGEMHVLAFDGRSYPYETEELEHPVDGTRYLDNPDDLQYGIPFGN